jgi:anti-anti-sigma factor
MRKRLGSPTGRRERPVTVARNDRPWIPVVEIEGALRAPVDGKLGRSVDALLSQGQRWILLDLGRLDAIDAAGIGELLRAYAATRAAGGVLQIAHARRLVRQLLAVAGLFSLLNAPAWMQASSLSEDDRRQISDDAATIRAVL